MEAHDKIARQYAKASCLKCSKDGCTLDLKGIAPPPLVLDADAHCELVKREGKKPDYYVFPIADQLVLVVVELKSGRLDASDAIDQIQAGATIWEPIMASSLSKFYPLLLCGRGGHANELKVLGRRRVRFLGKDYLVILRRCGSLLTEVLQTFQA